MQLDWSNVTLGCESEIKFLGVITEWPDSRPRRKLQPRLDSEQCAGLGSKPHGQRSTPEQQQQRPQLARIKQP